MNMNAPQSEFETAAAAAKAEAFAKDGAVYKTLLESTRAIPWKIDWAAMRFAYIGPQIETLLGWPQDSWQSVDDWVERMHPDDREASVNYCISQSQAGLDHEMDYRALNSAGEYVWIRDVIHVVRGPSGEAESLVGFMFDISARKAAEEEVLRLQRELERLSLTDGLTGIANRRLFDKRLKEEWQRACRGGSALSLVLLDIDFFKQYNDRYGHVRGDDCLREVAAALAGVTLRPGGLVARFGGEEFALLLPETSATEALQVAEACAAAIAAAALPHEGSAVSDRVTASIGVVTGTCQGQGQPLTLVEAADKQLYAAKRAGRARIEATTA